MPAVRVAGYPPVFILMYDQAWLLCERLFDAMEVTLTLTLTLTRYLVYQPEGEPLSLPLPKDVAAPRRGEQIEP